MRLTKTSEYAIRVLVYMANHPEERLSVNLLHERLNIPYKYLGKMMHNLAGEGLLVSSRGKTGGYRLNGPLGEISLARIIDAVEGLSSYDRCLLGFPQCSDEAPCPLHERWGPRRDAIKAMIYDTTLADLVDQEGVEF